MIAIGVFALLICLWVITLTIGLEEFRGQNKWFKKLQTDPHNEDYLRLWQHHMQTSNKFLAIAGVILVMMNIVVWGFIV